jgi:hypothetical protein
VVDDLDVGKLRTTVQETIGRMRGHNFSWKGFLGFKPRLVMFKNAWDTDVGSYVGNCVGGGLVVRERTLADKVSEVWWNRLHMFILHEQM